MGCHHFDLRHCDSEDLMFLIYHINSCDNVSKGLCNFMSGTPNWYANTFLCLVAIVLVPVEL